MTRKKPFSQKKKKEQLKARKERRKDRRGQWHHIVWALRSDFHTYPHTHTHTSFGFGCLVGCRKVDKEL